MVKRPYVTVVVGAQWGDEGKGKIVDLLTPDADFVVRFQGGANAGHTLVINGKKTVLHLLPSGVLHARVQCVIGNGVVLDPHVCLREIAECHAVGLPLEGRLHISSAAHVVLPHHTMIDTLREAQAGGAKIGTTQRGIGPAYESKVARRGLRCADLIHPDRLVARLREILPELNAIITKLYGGTPPALDETIAQYRAYGEQLRPFVTDTVALLHEALAQNKRLLLEGAQGTALDIDHGIYPFVTSSTTIAAGAASGSGVGPAAITSVLGVTKAYATRVGEGPFPTELHDALGESLRTRGGEFGSTTGRPRRCGWLDAVALRRAAQLNGFTGLVITKIDVLQGLPNVRIGVGYQLDGRERSSFPDHLDEWTRVIPVYEDLPGWTEPCDGAQSRADLPKALQHYLARIETLTRVPITLLSFGPERAAVVRV